MLFAVASVSPDSLIVRFLVQHGTSQWAIVTWKNIFAALFESFYVAWEAGTAKAILCSLRASPLHVAVGILMQTGLSITFNLALVHTSSAETLLIFSLNPIWSALLGYFVLGDLISRQTVAALVICVIAVGIICLPSILGLEVEEDSSHVGTSFLGNGLALSAGIFLSGLITSSRHASIRCPSCNMAAAVGLGSFCAGLGSLLLAEGNVLSGPSGFSGPSWQFWLPMLGGGLAEGIFFVVISIAPALVSGAEIGILSLLEVILGPLFVFCAFGDIPGTWTLVGGSILLSVQVMHELSGVIGAAVPTKAKSLEEGEQSSNQKSGDTLREMDSITRLGSLHTTGVGDEDPV